METLEPPIPPPLSQGLNLITPQGDGNGVLVAVCQPLKCLNLITPQGDGNRMLSYDAEALWGFKFNYPARGWKPAPGQKSARY